MKTVVCRLDLGYTRIAGYTLYDDETEEFYETTPREVKELIKNNKVNGLKLVDDEIMLDEEGFNQKNLMIKSGVGKYRPMNDIGGMINRLFTVLDIVDCGGEFRYEIITNYCGRRLIAEDQLRALDSMGLVAGLVIAEDNKIKLLNKKFTIMEKGLIDKDDEYKEIEELPEAKALISIDEEVKLGKEALERKETLKVESVAKEKVTKIEEGSLDKEKKEEKAGKNISQAKDDGKDTLDNKAKAAKAEKAEKDKKETSKKETKAKK